jgi:hypothetical protein
MLSISYQTWATACPFPYTTPTSVPCLFCGIPVKHVASKAHQTRQHTSRNTSQPYKCACPKTCWPVVITANRDNFQSSMEAAGWCLPTQIVEPTQQALLRGWAPQTTTNHAGAVSQYECFCQEIGVPSHLIWPAHEPAPRRLAHPRLTTHHQSTSSVIVGQSGCVHCLTQPNKLPHVARHASRIVTTTNNIHHLLLQPN